MARVRQPPSADRPNSERFDAILAAARSFNPNATVLPKHRCTLATSPCPIAALEIRRPYLYPCYFQSQCVRPGFNIDVIRELETCMNTRFDLVVFGEPGSTGDMVELLNSSLVDMIGQPHSAPLSLNATAYTNIEFSDPLMKYERVQMFKQKLLPLEPTFIPDARLAFFLALSILMVISLPKTIFRRHPLRRSVTKLTGVIQHRIAYLILLFLTTFFTLILKSFVQGLASNTLIETSQLPINSVEQLAKEIALGRYTLISVDTASSSSHMLDSYIQKHRPSWSTDDIVKVRSISERIALLRDDGQNFVTTVSHFSANSYIEDIRESNVLGMLRSGDQKSYGHMHLALSATWPRKQELHSCIRLALRGGLVQRFYNKYSPEVKAEGTMSATNIRVKGLAMALYTWHMGMCLAGFIWIAQHVHTMLHESLA